MKRVALTTTDGTDVGPCDAPPWGLPDPMDVVIHTMSDFCPLEIRLEPPGRGDTARTPSDKMFQL